MARNSRKSLWGRSLQRTLRAITRSAVRLGTKAVGQGLRAASRAARPVPAKRRAGTLPAAAKRSAAPAPAAVADHWRPGVALGLAGPRRYWLFKPGGIGRAERLPLMVMLHGCGQDAESFAASSRMNRLARRQRFLVLYPAQDRIANGQACWNWFDTRSGRAQREADSILAAIDQVCRLRAVDPNRIALAGLSAGAGMAALVAIRAPGRFRALAMHSGIAPGVAHSSATALHAMLGHRHPGAPAAAEMAGAAGLEGLAGVPQTGLLVIQGSADHLVAPGNGTDAARWWAARAGAVPGRPRIVQRGSRYAATITDYRSRSGLVASLCEVSGLGHAWSGGTKGLPYSDPKGPDATAMIWAFAARQFDRGA